MLSGDRPENADKLGRSWGSTCGRRPHARGQARPFQADQEKAGGTTIFVGDGMNDAPCWPPPMSGLPWADWAPAAIGAADAVLLGTTRRAADSITIARRTKTIMRQNIAFALGVKGLVLVMGALALPPCGGRPPTRWPCWLPSTPPGFWYIGSVAG